MSYISFISICIILIGLSVENPRSREGRQVSNNNDSGEEPTPQIRQITQVSQSWTSHPHHLVLINISSS